MSGHSHQLYSAKQIALALPQVARLELVALLLATLDDVSQKRAITESLEIDLNDPVKYPGSIRRAIGRGLRRDSSDVNAIAGAQILNGDRKALAALRKKIAVNPTTVAESVDTVEAVPQRRARTR